MSSKLGAVAVIVLAASLLFAQQKPAATADVTRATLDNGMRVVIIRDPLAPVVTVEENYLVGGNETPAGFPGMAHAQEHMAFRGCTGVTADQIAAIYAQLGGFNNADTQQNITQYFATDPRSRSRHRLARRRRLHAGHSGFADRMGPTRRAPSNRKWPATSPTPPISSSLA